ncbi:T9SS type A sorting domain-containing protein [Cryomorphaceae bacterium]|nr:T9SS type A sorting domain-containing protein [Cryomorphaceae bacterium]
MDAGGAASITAQDVDNGSSDACGVASIAIDNSSFGCANVGPNTVTLTVTDNNGNVSTCTSTVTVEDNIAPSLTVPADIFVCDGDVVNYPVPVGTDNCSATTTQTQGMPYTNGSVFPLGVTTVEYTAVDPSGNSVSMSFDVTVHPLPSVSVAQSELGEYCQGGAIVLTADAPTAVAYAWSNGGTSDVTEVFASGTYSVTVTNQFGCTSVASIPVTYTGEDLLSSYTILANKEVKLHDNNLVVNGGVGVLGNNRKAKIYKNTTVAGPNTFVMADVIQVHQNATVSNQIIGQPNVTLPTFLYANCGGSDVTVHPGTTVTLNGTKYDEIEVEDNATVIFTQSDVSIDELEIEDGATVKFASCTYLRVEEFEVEKNVTFNPDGYKVVVFTEDKVEIDRGVTFNGSIYSKEDLKVRSKASNPTTMTGFFIARKVKGYKHTIWNWDTNCDNSCPTVVASKEGTPAIEFTEEGEQEMFETNLYPNPSSGVSNFTVEMTEGREVVIEVYNMQGVRVMEVHRGFLNPVARHYFEINGQQLATGMYQVVLQSGEEIKAHRWIIQR